jgi:hypothetical protein
MTPIRSSSTWRQLAIVTLPAMAFALFGGLPSYARDETADRTDTTVIEDVAHWQHPVRAILKKHKVELQKVVLKSECKYPVFYVSFPYDPQSSATRKYFDELYFEVLRANGYWSYAFDDAMDGLLIHVNWDRKRKTMSVEFEDIGTK